jgi:hypothetical protein
MQTINRISTKVDILSSYLHEHAPSCIHEPDGMLPFRFVTPTSFAKPGADDNAQLAARSAVGHYLQMYDWDACFFAQGADELGINHNFGLEVVGNFLSLQQADGYIPRTVSPMRIWDAGDVCKPFLSQTITRSWERDPQSTKKLSNEMISGLEKHLLFFQLNRMHRSGMYHWRNVLESGVDDNLALLAPMEAAKDENEHIGDVPDGSLIAVDLCSYLVLEYLSFAEIAAANGLYDLSEKYAHLSLHLSAQVEQHLWNDELGMYCNFCPNSDQQYKMRSWTGLLPALLGFASEDRIQQVIERNILNPEHFLRPAGLASMAASEHLYNQGMRGLYGRAIVCNWQGPVWVLPNILAVRCLLAQKMHRAAEELAIRVVKTLADCIVEKGVLFENYNAETGQPLWAPKFMSWNVLALELTNLLS